MKEKLVHCDNQNTRGVGEDDQWAWMSWITPTGRNYQEEQDSSESISDPVRAEREKRRHGEWS